MIFALAILQLIGVFWVYGMEKFCWDVQFMLEWTVTTFWRILWLIITPGLMIIIFIYTMATLQNPTFTSKPYPTWCHVIGWLIFAIGVLQFFFWSLWEILKSDNKLQAFKALFKQNPLWGPNSSRIFNEWKEFKVKKQASRALQTKNQSHSKTFWQNLTAKND